MGRVERVPPILGAYEWWDSLHSAHPTHSVHPAPCTLAPRSPLLPMPTLIIVDVQNDFCPGGALAVPEGDRIVPLINSLQPRYELVVATQDWHPADHGSFAASHPGRSPGELIELAGLPQILWPVHCVQGTPGGVPSRLESRPGRRGPSARARIRRSTATAAFSTTAVAPRPASANISADRA